MADKVIAYVTFAGPSGSPFTVPADWSNVNKIEVIGQGGVGWGGDPTVSGFGGGGGGGYSCVENITTLTPGQTFYVCANGLTTTNPADAWVGTTSLAASAFVLAKAGSPGASETTRLGGQGGQASAGIGTVKYSGGNGGNGLAGPSSSGGGGGAAGPNGNGGKGGNGDPAPAVSDYGGGGGGANGGAAGVDGSSLLADNGGVGNNGGGKGGAGGSGNGQSGLVGSLWATTHNTAGGAIAPVWYGPGGGGGGGGSVTPAAGGTGANAGGGGGGGLLAGGPELRAGSFSNSGPGLCIITYAPVTTINTMRVKDAGTWKTPAPSVKHVGAWKIPTSVWVRDAGIWKKVFG